MGNPTWGMRPAGAGGSLPPKPVVDLSDVRENALGRPTFGRGTGVFSSAGPRTRGTIASVALSNAAGTLAPVDFAGLSVPVVAGVQFSAVAEVHSSAVDLVDDTSVVRANEQRSDGSGDPGRSPGMVDRPVTNISALELLEHSVLDEDLDSRPMEGLSVPELLEHSVPDEELDGRPMEGLFVPEPLEHSVLDEDLDGRPMEGRSGPRPLEHSVPDVILERSSREELSGLEPLEHSIPEVASDIRHIRGRTAMGPLEHSVPDLPQRTTPDPLEHSGLPSE